MSKKRIGATLGLAAVLSLGTILNPVTQTSAYSPQDEPKRLTLGEIYKQEVKQENYEDYLQVRAMGKVQYIASSNKKDTKKEVVVAKEENSIQQVKKEKAIEPKKAQVKIEDKMVQEESSVKKQEEKKEEKVIVAESEKEEIVADNTVELAAKMGQELEAPVVESQEETIVKGIETQGWTTDSLNVRTAPDKFSGVIMTLQKDTYIQGMESNGWIKISYNDTVGYVMKDYITNEDPAIRIQKEKEEARKVEEQKRAEEQRKLEEQKRLEEEKQANKKKVEKVKSSLSDTTTAGKIAQNAYNLLGSSYVFGAADPAIGFDCSGFVYYLYQQYAGINLSRSTYTQRYEGRMVDNDDLQPGDLIFFPGYDHVALYVGNGKYIHASTPETGVIEGDITDGYFSSRVEVRRILD